MTTELLRLAELCEQASGPDRMPVISLWQPWASLIFTGDKLHETRAYKPPAKYIGQRIAIHAAKSCGPVTVGLHELCSREWGHTWACKIPRGAIIGTARLVQAYETDEPFVNTSRIDRMCGDWSPGRYAWLLKDVEALPEPLPAKGKQGWWSVDAASLRARSQESNHG